MNDTEKEISPESEGIDMDRIANYLKLRDDLATAEAEVKRIKGEIDTDEKMLVEQFVMSGVKGLVTSTHNIHTHVSRYANAPKEHRAALVAWARDNGLEDMITLQPQSFSSWCRERLECDEADPDSEPEGLPDEIASMISVHEKIGLRVRKA